MTSVLLAASPLVVVAVGALLIMVAEALAKKAKSADLALLSAIVLATAAFMSAVVYAAPSELAEGASALAPYILADRYAALVDLIICIGAAVAALLAGAYLPEHDIDRAEFFPLLLFATVGAMVLAGAGDLLSLMLGLETMSLGVYAMTGLRRGSSRSAEAAMKYFLLGSFAAAILVYGGALLYGATGHTDFAGIGAALASPGRDVSVPIAVVGLMLLLVGLVFKVSAVPFHMWTPDAYEELPTPATTFMAVVVKSAAFAVLLRVLLTAFGDSASASWGAGWPAVLIVLSVLTMSVANLIAGRQESVKRMLAYSSIAHAGYVMIGVVAATDAQVKDAQASVLFYLLAYTVSTAGAFGTLILCGRRGAETVTYDDLAGIGRRHPAAALAFSLFLLSLAGVPPTVGFAAKLYVFRAAFAAGASVPWLYWLAVIGLLNTVLGAYYYLRVLVFMYMREPAPGAPVAVPMRSGYVVFALVVCALLVIALGVMPGVVDLALLAPARG